MILVKRNMLHFIFAVLILFMIILGASGYILLNKIDYSNKLDVKFYSETIVFMTIFFIFVSAISYVIVHVKNINVLKQLDKIIEITKYGNYDIEKSLVKLSDLGDKIKDLHYHLNILNRQKALKISSLSNLLNFFLRNTELCILVTDIQGLITNASEAFFEKFNAEPALVLYNNIDFIKEIDFTNLVITIDDSREKMVKEKVEFELNKKKYEVNIM
ncbi:MAG TPA: hypothetical protein PLO89_02345, partial [Spirochaetota bacterium]|nr:hypothetical protein [Spirochaetota bacterium]